MAGKRNRTKLLGHTVPTSRRYIIASLQIAFFCGHADECTYFGSRQALARAIANVERHFSVVGVLERMRESLDVMREFVPR